MSGVSGQNSSASASTIGRPTAMDTRKTQPTTSDPSTGWAKYTKVLPLAIATVVRIVIPIAPSTSSGGTGRRRTHRHATAAYSQNTAAAYAAPIPLTTRQQ